MLDGEELKKEEPRKMDLLAIQPNKKGGGFLGWVLKTQKTTLFVLYCIVLLLLAPF